METRDELDRLISSITVEECGRLPKNPGCCPDDYTISQYVDGTLGKESAETLEEHLCRCMDCIELVILAGSAPPQEGMDKAPAALKQKSVGLLCAKKASTLDIVVRFARDVMELVSSTGTVMQTPSPSFARGEAKTSGNLLSVSKRFDGIKVEVDVEKLETGAMEVSVSAKQAGGVSYKRLRASLFEGARESMSLYMEDGRATFDQIPPNRYTIRISDTGETLGEISLDIIPV